MFNIEMGATVKDKVTNYTGMVTARIEFLGGCIQYKVERTVGTDKELAPSHYFDEDRLQVIRKATAKLKRARASSPKRNGAQDRPPSRRAAGPLEE